MPMSLVQLAASLFHANALRVGFTQYIKVGKDPQSPYSRSPIPLKRDLLFQRSMRRDSD